MRITTAAAICLKRQRAQHFRRIVRVKNIVKRHITSSRYSSALAYDSSIYESSYNNYDTIPDDIADLVKEYSSRKQTSVSLQTLLETGRNEFLPDLGCNTCERVECERVLVKIADFLLSELPVRLAYRIQDLDNVPMLRDMPSVQAVKAKYINTFLELIQYPNKIESPRDEAEFANFVERKYDQHANVLIQMARGAFELREEVRQKTANYRPIKFNNNHCEEFELFDTCHSFLDRFFMSRIGVRVLVGQYLKLRQQCEEQSHPVVGSRSDNYSRYLGLVCLETSTYDIVQHAINDATMMCERRYGIAPEVTIAGRLDLTFPYIPTYLHYILLELLKNAMRATMETHGDKNDIPDVTVIIADSTKNEDVVIKVMDEGGGIARSQMDKKIWSYLFTTESPRVQNTLVGCSNTIPGGSNHYDNDNHNHYCEEDSSPMAGLGFGLPISRAYARYFGGDLDIMSMEGYGTDAFIHLKRLVDHNCQEPLPSCLTKRPKI